jgi:hypothetical protein
MSITVTVPSTSAKVLVFGYVNVSNDTAGKKTFIYIDRGGTNLTYGNVQVVDANEYTGFTLFYCDSGVSGSTTYKLQWKVDAGTGYCYGRNIMVIVIP